MVDDIKLPKRDRHPDDFATNKADAEPTFTPPEVLAQEEEVIDMAEPADSRQPTASSKKKLASKKPSRFSLLYSKFRKWWKARSKKQKIIIAVAGVLLVALLAGGAYALLHKPTPAPAPVAKEEVKEPPKPTTEASNLTGLQVGFEVNKLPVTGVMTGNNPDARPQSGLSEAGVVFEAVAEGGITRFLALFQDTKPAHVGPVRSARLYYIRWLLGFDATFAHAGGSPQALQDIRALGVKDIDHGANGSTFDRVSNRYAPHNLYTSIDRLIATAAGRGYTSSTYTPLARKPEKKIETPAASSIDIAISSNLYNVRYTYDTANNSYLRFQGGQAHTDEKSGAQINAKVVVVIVTDKSQSGIYSVYRTSGSGPALVFQDGNVINGTWTKADDKAQFTFKDAHGAELKLNAGKTWFTIVGLATSVTYTP